MLAFLARFGSPGETTGLWSSIDGGYGPSPNFRIRPRPDSADETFYPRQGAHVLWALAIRDFF